MIFHLVNDDKFIDYTINKFDSLFPLENRYIILSDFNKNSINKIKSKEIIEIFPLNGNTFIDQLNRSDIVIIHFLTLEFAKIINLIPIGITIVWMCWGGDLYDRTFLYNTQLNFEKKSLQYFINSKKLQKKSAFKTLFFKTLKKIGAYNFYYKLRTGENSYEYIYKNAIRRVQYISTVCDCEQEVLKKHLPIKKSIFIDYSYGDTKVLLGAFYNIDIKLGENILLGNSATISNNHIDAFPKIKKIIHDNTKIICPLNYGDETYKNLVIDIGTKQFGSNFLPLTKWMELDEYNKLLTTCDTMIMFHIRQQALGNILLGLYLGMKVFLNNKSPLFNYFKEKGFIIFSFQEEFNNRDNILIDGNNLLLNRKLIEENWSEDVVNSKIYNSLIKIKEVIKSK